MNITRDELRQLAQHTRTEWMLTFMWHTDEPALSSWDVSEKVIYGLNQDQFEHYAWGADEATMRNLHRVLMLCKAKEVKLARRQVSHTDWVGADE